MNASHINNFKYAQKKKLKTKNLRPSSKKKKKTFKLLMQNMTL